MSIIPRLSMRISSQMTEAINNQIAYEASAVHAYIAIGSWCERTGYDGSAAFFFEQANEELRHMLKFIHYLNNSGAEPIIPAIDKTSSQFRFTRVYFPSRPKKRADGYWTH